MPAEVILAIESSCDESAVALFDPQRGLTGEWVSSQVELHGRYGGIVPELATREHLANLPLLLEEAAVHEDWPNVSKVVVTAGPGLAGCLALGVAAAKSVAIAREVPLAGVNHLRAHAWSAFIPLHAEDPDCFCERLQSLLPHVGLLVSGGNTVLFVVNEQRQLSLLGATIDDAAGEALDKGAKLMGLGYPGGPLVEKLATAGDAKAFDFPRALPTRGDCNFSFSGLKTSLRYRIAAMDEAELQDRKRDLCASYQAAVIDVLVRKTGFAIEAAGAASVGLSGGVANNLVLRDRLARISKDLGIPFLPAPRKHTGDNAGMIAFCAWADPAVLLSEAAGIDLAIEPSLPIDR